MYWAHTLTTIRVTAKVGEKKMEAGHKIDWNCKASVRARPRRILSDEDSSYFPAELAPIAQHPLIINLGLSNEFLIQSLYLHLSFTMKLEQEVVNSVVYQIAHRKIDRMDLPQDMIIEAYQIYVDEAYHAYFCADFQSQLEATTGCKAINISPASLGKFLEIQSSYSKPIQQLLEVFFVFVSETLISGILTEIPRDKRVKTSVRQLISDHAIDETRHHLYFSRLFPYLWSALNRQERILIGTLLPQFIQIFVGPDYPALQTILDHFNLKPQEIELVIKESYPLLQVATGIRKAAKTSLAVLERNKVFEEPQIFKAFQSSGLLQ